MCGRLLGRMLSVVSTSTVHIEIEAHVGDDEMGGQIRSNAGPPSSFTGWLGLISALDPLLSAGVGLRALGTLPNRGDAPGTNGEGRDK